MRCEKSNAKKRSVRAMKSGSKKLKMVLEIVNVENAMIDTGEEMILMTEDVEEIVTEIDAMTVTGLIQVLIGIETETDVMIGITTGIVQDHIEIVNDRVAGQNMKTATMEIGVNGVTVAAVEATASIKFNHSKNMRYPQTIKNPIQLIKQKSKHTAIFASHLYEKIK